MKSMMSLFRMIVLSVGVWCGLSQAAFAQGQVSAATADTIKSAVETWLKGRYTVDSVLPTPLTGVYEVRIGTELIYVDQAGRHAFVESQLIDLKSGENLTQARMEEILTIKFSDLPLQYALKTVRGQGKRVIAVFEDPNCGYCRQFRRQLLGMSDITVYTFIYPILSPDSDAKAKAVWCSKDRLKVWDDWMLNNKSPDSSKANCDTPMEKIVELGRKLSVTGTPTVFFANGKRATGAIPAAKLEQMFAMAAK